jgi:hypothetical protein
MDMSELRLNRVKRKNRVKPSTVQEIRKEELFVGILLTYVSLWGGGQDVNMIGCLLIDRALGTDVGHLISKAEYR